MLTEAKRDFKKELKYLYQPSSKDISQVVVPPMNFLKLDGRGNPNSEDFALATSTLYGLAYALRFMSKRQGIEYSVMPLEGLWWSGDMDSFLRRDKSAWQWTVMLMQPEFITQAMFVEAMATQEKKNPTPLLNQVRFETYDEGCAAQILYIGSYDNETDTIQRLHEYIHAQGRQLFGKHHEIYLSDPRRGDPAKLKTVIRQPMR